MKIAILGAGAMGQLFGAHLSAAGHEVVMVDVSQETCDHINAHGLHIEMGTHQVHAVARAALAHQLDEVVDLVFVMTKGPHTRAALNSVRHLMNKNTVGMTLQNGLGTEVPLLEYFDADRAIIGMTDFPADRQADGTVISEATGHITIGEISPGGAETAQRIARVFDDAAVATVYATDVKIPIWEKVIFNTMYNTVTAATGLTVGGVFDEPEAKVLANAVLDEALTVAKQEAIAIDEVRLHQSIDNAHKNHSAHKTSMLTDLEAGRPTELETIGGAVEKLGEKHHLRTPYLSVLCDVIRLRERAAGM